MGLREPFNAVSHGLGVLGAIAGLVYLVYRAESGLATLAMAVYGGSLVALFLASTLYHGVPADRRVRRILRRVDHVAIFLLIAGTYTPVTLLALSPGWGWSIFGVVWGLTIVGIVAKVVYVDIPRWANAVIYLAMSWTALVAVEPMIEVFPWGGLAWLLGGGVAYTLGAIIYAVEWPDPLPDYVGAHGLWHVFVLAGSALHYVFIAGYVPPS